MARQTTGGNVKHTLERAKVQLELESQLASRQLRRLEKTIQEQGWVSQTAQQQQRALLEKIDRFAVARQRIQTGAYGLCTTCGQPIAAERLEAVPDTTLCVSCKDKTVRNRLRTTTLKKRQAH